MDDEQEMAVRRPAALVELTAEFDRRLAQLNVVDTRGRIEAAMAAQGRVMPRPQAGISF